MLKAIQLPDQELNYTVNINRRAKGLRLSVHGDGRVVVTIPKLIYASKVEKFLLQKSDWIVSKINYYSEHQKTLIQLTSDKSLTQLKTEALVLVQNRLAYFNQFYNLQCGRITIRNQSSRWGSCSKQGNLNFNYRLALLPPEQADYIIVHELCHLKELNHSKNFWKLVAQTIPNYSELRKRLNKYYLR